MVFFASRRETNKVLNEKFKNDLEALTRKYGAKMEIAIKPPKEEKGLQVVDFVCRSAFQKWENKDEQYYEIIQPLVVQEIIYH
jgi:hypothetical protein